MLLKPFFHMLHSQPCVRFHVNVRFGDIHDSTAMSSANLVGEALAPVAVSLKDM